MLRYMKCCELCQTLRRMLPCLMLSAVRCIACLTSCVLCLLLCLQSSTVSATSPAGLFYCNVLLSDARSCFVVPLLFLQSSAVSAALPAGLFYCYVLLSNARSRFVLLMTSTADSVATSNVAL